ncbi:choline transporter-like protein 2 [Saccostrea echinata]|uniref:choline transporter-like protein 2 n=1 Tax=Saccostrea echinata TaxID=191078 RepID=UPI002A83D4FD|nr:choline transporter-like protein 2 [Saccostrea echinata]
MGAKVGDEKSEDKEKSSDEKKEYMGDPRKYDPNFNGPIKNRSCTDIICCLLFLIFLAGMVVCSAIGYARGNPYKLLYPTDSSGNICGYDTGYTDKPYLVYFDMLKCAKSGSAVIITGCSTPQVCVKTCPSTYWYYLYQVALETATTKTVADRATDMICKGGTDTSVGTIQNLVDTKACAPYYVKSTPVVGRCIPSFFLEITDWAQNLVVTASGTDYNLTNTDGEGITGNAMNEASYWLAQFMSASEVVERIYKDVVASWWLLLVFLGAAMVTCFIWIVLMRWLTGIIVWFTIFAVLAVLSYACYYSYTQYFDLKTKNVTGEWGYSEAFALNFSYYLQLKETWLAFACGTATFLSIFVLLLIFLLNRICIAIELIKEGSRAIGNMIFTLIWPVFPFFLQLIVVGYFGFSSVYIASIGDQKYYTNGTNTTDDGINYYLSRIPCEPDGTTQGSYCDFVKYGGTEYIVTMQVFMLFMFFWTMNFVVAMGQMVLAGAFASYYWAFEKPKDIPAFPLSASLWRTFRYHFGSLAFGSLIIAIIQMIRVGLEYLDHKLKGSENAVAKFLLKILKCCFWCLEKFMRFLNRNAYILIAVYGKNFCTSAKDAFFLILRNIVRVVVLDKITDYVLFLSKLLVTASVGVAAYYWFQGKITYFSEYVPTDINYYITPVILVIIGTYVICCCFFSVYEMAVDTLFLCFLEDLEMNDGSAEKPYFMSKGLMNILGKKNLKPGEKKKCCGCC